MTYELNHIRYNWKVIGGIAGIAGIIALVVGLCFAIFIPFAPYYILNSKFYILIA